VRFPIFTRSVLLWMLIFALVGVAFGASGAFWWAHFNTQISQLRSDTQDFETRSQSASADIQKQKEDATAEINSALAPLKGFLTETQTIQLSQTFSPSVYQVATLDDTGQPSVGTAFSVITNDQESFMLTSYTTVRAATVNPGPAITLTKGTEQIPASIVNWDPAVDLALLRVEKGNITVLDWAGNDVLASALGSRIFPISGTGGAGATLTGGTLIDQSAAGFQHTAPLGHDFQGGPVINGDGKVIGVASLTYWPLGYDNGPNIHFSPPIGAACNKVLNCTGGNRAAGPPGGLTRRIDMLCARSQARCERASPIRRTRFVAAPPWRAPHAGPRLLARDVGGHDDEDAEDHHQGGDEPEPAPADVGVEGSTVAIELRAAVSCSFSVVDWFCRAPIASSAASSCCRTVVVSSSTDSRFWRSSSSWRWSTRVLIAQAGDGRVLGLQLGELARHGPTATARRLLGLAGGLELAEQLVVLVLQLGDLLEHGLALGQALLPSVLAHRLEAQLVTQVGHAIGLPGVDAAQELLAVQHDAQGGLEVERVVLVGVGPVVASRPQFADPGPVAFAELGREGRTPPPVHHLELEVRVAERHQHVAALAELGGGHEDPVVARKGGAHPGVDERRQSSARTSKATATCAR